LVLPFSKEAAVRPNSVVADSSINHSSDHAVPATLGRQGRPRRPVLTFDNGGLACTLDGCAGICWPESVQHCLTGWCLGSGRTQNPRRSCTSEREER
jgi:hypothetical protein